MLLLWCQVVKNRRQQALYLNPGPVHMPLHQTSHIESDSRQSEQQHVVVYAVHDTSTQRVKSKRYQHEVITHSENLECYSAKQL